MKEAISFSQRIAASIQDKKDRKNQFGYLQVPESVKVLTIEENTSELMLDILPYIVTDEHHPERNDRFKVAVPGTEWYRRPYMVHKNVGSDNITVICPRSFGKKCPICEHVRERMKAGEQWDAVSDIAAKKRSLFYVIPIGSKKHDEIVHIWDISDFLFHDELQKQIELNPEYGEFPSVDNGYTLQVGLRWKDFKKKKFYETIYVKFLKRQPYDAKFIEELPSLDTVISALSYEEIQQKFFEMDAEDTDTEQAVQQEEPEKTMRPRRRPADAVQTDKNDDDQPPFEPDKPAQNTVRIPAGKIACPACLGSGKNSKGAKCPICLGRGWVEPKQNEEPEQESVGLKKTNGSAAPATDNRCPNGHRFGLDAEKFNDCDSCPTVTWNECVRANQQQ